MCKTVYTVKGRPDLVIAIAKPLFGWILEREIAGLAALRDSELPTVRVHQTGWTALVASCLERVAETRPDAHSS